MNNAQALEDAAADMVARVKGLSPGPSEAKVSVFAESSAPVGTPLRSETCSEEDTDFKASIDLKSNSGMSADHNEYEDHSNTAQTGDLLYSTSC